MIWVIIVVAIIAACLDSDLGKIVMGAAVLAIGLLLLKWITGFSVFVTFAKICAIVIVATIVGSILLAIFG